MQEITKLDLPPDHRAIILLQHAATVDGEDALSDDGWASIRKSPVVHILTQLAFSHTFYSKYRRTLQTLMGIALMRWGNSAFLHVTQPTMLDSLADERIVAAAMNDNAVEAFDLGDPHYTAICSGHMEQEAILEELERRALKPINEIFGIIKPGSIALAIEHDPLIPMAGHAAGWKEPRSLGYLEGIVIVSDPKDQLTVPNVLTNE